MDRNYRVLTDFGQTKLPIKAWVKGVEIEREAIQQLSNVANLPFIYKHVAVMPDVHAGKGSTVGAVIPTRGAVIPAAVGVDIGCGMIAVRTSLTAEDLPEGMAELRASIEHAVPFGGPGTTGTWAEQGRHGPPNSVMASMQQTGLQDSYKLLLAKHPKFERKAGNTNLNQLGTLGGGNHFIEVCLDEGSQPDPSCAHCAGNGYDADSGRVCQCTLSRVWVMLHSGSRGVGNRIGEYFIDIAREDMRKHFINLPDKDLAYLVEGTEHFDEYWKALTWAQLYAKENRAVMLKAVLRALADHTKPFSTERDAVNCHHNYATREHHFGENVVITRKGAISAREGQLGIIPGNMGARSFIVRGKGSTESFMSASHGAGRRMSRTEAKRTFTLEDHIKATEGVECRKDSGVLDETPGAYKDVDQVIAAQSDLIEVVHTLKQVLCVKG